MSSSPASVGPQRQNFPSVQASHNSIAALAFLTWDIILTIDDEVQYVWRRPFVQSSYLYLFVRYFAWVAQVSRVAGGIDTLVSSHRLFSPNQCRSWVIWEAVSAEIELAAVEILLIMRVHALYNRSRKLLHWLLGIFALEIVVMSASLEISVAKSRSDADCNTIVPLTILGYGVASIAFETLLLVMTSVKFVKAIRAGWGDLPVIRTIIRDGVWAFALIFLAILTNSLLYGLVTNALAAAGFPWLLSISSFAGYRLLLNVRQAGRRGLQETDMPTGVELNTGFEFATCSPPDSSFASADKGSASASASAGHQA